tara:strand:- start:767 stop:1183 length:417 start_codon:yes stop_codon:yes gene_type:complete
MPEIVKKKRLIVSFGRKIVNVPIVSLARKPSGIDDFKKSTGVLGNYHFLYNKKTGDLYFDIVFNHNLKLPSGVFAIRSGPPGKLTGDTRTNSWYPMDIVLPYRSKGEHMLEVSLRVRADSGGKTKEIKEIFTLQFFDN